MEKLVRDYLPTISINNWAPIRYRKVNDVQEHTQLLLAKIWEEEKELQNARYYAHAWTQGSKVHPIGNLSSIGIHWKVLDETWDVLTASESLIRIYKSIGDDSRAHELQQKVELLLLDLITEGYKKDDIDAVQKEKTHIFGAFNEWIVGIFKKNAFQTCHFYGRKPIPNSISYDFLYFYLISYPLSL